MAETKISPYSPTDLKNTTDDALANYLRGLQCKQDNSKLDVRLAIGYTSVVIAAATFAADYKLGWEATKTWTAVAVVAYALLNGAFTYWMWAVEKGLVFEGTASSGKKIAIHSKAKKHDPTYYLDVSVTDPGSSSPSSWHIRAPYTTWFTADGFFVAKPLQQWLASSIEAIGDIDTRNAGRDERDELASPGPGDRFTPVTAVEEQSNGSVSASGADRGGKGTKRGKKKA